MKLESALVGVSQIEEQLQVISRTTEQLKRQTVAPKKHKLSEFWGIAPNLIQGRDAQDWVNQLRENLKRLKL